MAEQQVQHDRLERLQTHARLRSEAKTISAMIHIYCNAHHSHQARDASGLCEACKAFEAYALKRLACCPYQDNKPVCQKCKIHCYRPAERELAREIMRYSGPRLIVRHPILALKHVLDSRRPAPEKPRNTKGNATRVATPNAEN